VRSTSTPATIRIPAAAPALASALAILSACAGSGDGARREVSATEFVDPAAPPPEATPIAPTPAAASIADAEDPADAPPPSAVAVVGAPPAPDPDAPDVASGEPLVIDQMVGQINGKPVYADEFFTDMDARLRREATRKRERQWLRDVREDIRRRLWDRTRDELLLAEFQTSLTPQQRVGVLAFIEDIRENIESMAGGSAEVANERLQEEEGVTLREKVQDVAERQFILEQLRRSIASRVQVSFRDIKQFYEQNIDRFTPPAVARFRVIRAPLVDTQRIARIEDELASGAPFDQVAAAESDWAVDGENRHEVVIEAESYEDQRFFAGALDGPTRALGEGEDTGRIDHGRWAWWIRLDEVSREGGQSLYEVQLAIEEEIRAQRVRAEEQRYFISLLERSNVSDFDLMVQRLLDYAAERYLIQGDRAG
jgi:hypothetical protein